MRWTYIDPSSEDYIDKLKEKYSDLDNTVKVKVEVVPKSVEKKLQKQKELLADARRRAKRTETYERRKNLKKGIKPKVYIRYRKKREKRDYILQVYEKPYNFLQYYGLLKTYYCLKHSIWPAHFDRIFMFYNKVVTHESMMAALRVFVDNPDNEIKRYTHYGYIECIELLDEKSKWKVKTKPSNNFKLTTKMSNIISEFYMNLSMTSKVTVHYIRNVVPPEMWDAFDKLNEEIDLIKRGQLEPDCIKERMFKEAKNPMVYTEFVEWNTDKSVYDRSIFDKEKRGMYHRGIFKNKKE